MQNADLGGFILRVLFELTLYGSIAAFLVLFVIFAVYGFFKRLMGRR